MSVKIRKVGTPKVLTVPAAIGEVGTEYEVFSGREGAIVYLPAKQNPFKDQEFIRQHRFDGDTTGFIEAGIADHEL